jgi:hypothetical protein
MGITDTPSATLKLCWRFIDTANLDLVTGVGGAVDDVEDHVGRVLF